MNTIKCRIKVNEHHDVPGIGVTPAECVILRQIHDPAAATFSKSAPPAEKKNFWKFIINPVADSVAQTVIPGDETDTFRDRTNAEEVARLRAKYNVRAKSGAQGSHIMDDLYPGESPDLPQTFEEIGLEVAPPAPKPAKKSKAVKAPFVPETSEGTDEDGQQPTAPGETAGQDADSEVKPPKTKPTGRGRGRVKKTEQPAPPAET